MWFLDTVTVIKLPLLQAWTQSNDGTTERTSRRLSVPMLNISHEWMHSKWGSALFTKSFNKTYVASNPVQSIFRRVTVLKRDTSWHHDLNKHLSWRRWDCWTERWEFDGGLNRSRYMVRASVQTKAPVAVFAERTKSFFNEDLWTSLSLVFWDSEKGFSSRCWAGSPGSCDDEMGSRPLRRANPPPWFHYEE